VIVHDKAQTRQKNRSAGRTRKWLRRGEQNRTCSPRVLPTRHAKPSHPVLDRQLAAQISPLQYSLREGVKADQLCAAISRAKGGGTTEGQTDQTTQEKDVPPGCHDRFASSWRYRRSEGRFETGPQTNPRKPPALTASHWPTETDVPVLGYLLTAAKTGKINHLTHHSIPPACWLECRAASVTNLWVSRG